MFIFDRYCRSSAAVTPVKYERDINNLTGTFARSKILLTGKSTNAALVTPTPGQFNISLQHCIAHSMTESKVYTYIPDFGLIIEKSHKFHNPPVSYRHHSEQKHVHFCSQWFIVGYGKGCILGFVNLVYLRDSVPRPHGRGMEFRCV